VRPFVGDSAATFASLPPIGIPPQKVTDLLFHHVAESRAFLSGVRLASELLTQNLSACMRGCEG